MLVVGCTYTLDDRAGSLTELAIARPDAYQIIDAEGKPKLFDKIRTKEQREKREKYEDWAAS